MEKRFDPAEDAKNWAKHGISLEDAWLMDLIDAVVFQDIRVDYGENRFVAIGAIRGQIQTLVFTRRPGNIRPISLRTASRKEIKLYEQEIKATGRLGR